MKLTLDFSNIEDAVRQVETAFGSGRGEEKRKAAVALINAAVDIPFVPEPLEGVLFGLLVDLVVHLYNRWWGHDWTENGKGKTERVGSHSNATLPEGNANA
jgi:hypothetical protein